MREVRLRFVQVLAVFAAPVKRLSRRALQSAQIDVPLLENRLLLRTEVFTHHSDHAHIREVARGQTKIRRRSAQFFLHTP